MIDTKQKILDTAERLFSSQGYDATSLRHIIAEAGVNLAAIHYHFGSKDELLDELIMRKAGPVNRERMARLDQVEAEAAGRRPSLEKVLEAFLLPMSEAADRNPQFVRLMGRIHAEGLMQSVVRRHFQEIIARFFSAMRKAVPELPEQEFLWRVHFMVGAMAHTMCGAPDYTWASLDPSDFQTRMARLVTFLSGGFRAPLSHSKNIEVSQ
jgi:AcrR family transcriptional regulator